MFDTKRMTVVLLRPADLPLEVVILLIGGMIMLLTGIVLFAVSQNVAPYYQNGVYGLLLVIFALQTVTLGKTPFGELRRSRLVLAAGVAVAAVGIAACFIPSFTLLPRWLLLVCFGPGGLLLLLQMILSHDKLRTWLKYGGIFRHLIAGCFTVYGFSILLALVLWQQNLSASRITATIVTADGLAICYLAAVIWKIYRAYPHIEQNTQGAPALSTEQTILLLMGVFMLILGVLLIPVNVGWLPFSPSAQLGLLLVIFAVQMLAAGSTPIGPFPRTWLIIVCGFLFAALGIVSCLVPEILLKPLTVLVGLLNILGGVITLARIGSAARRPLDASVGPRPRVLTQLFAAQVILNLLTIMFGVAMLIPGVVPGLVIGAILAANGCVLLYLLRVLCALDALRGAQAAAA